MKVLLTSSLLLFFGLSCLGQEVEFCGSLNTSNEKRFQNSSGIGLQYQHQLGIKFKVGFGVHYNFNNIEFDNIPYVDADPNLIIIQKINSSSKRFSFRINIQGLLKNTEYVSISLGPEISYNYFWGQDQIDERIGQNSNRFLISQKNSLTKEVGFGLISKIEVKDFIDPRVSLCFTIRPEITTDGKFMKGGTPIFSGVLGFTEFQIGLSYSFEKLKLPKDESKN